MSVARDRLIEAGAEAHYNATFGNGTVYRWRDGPPMEPTEDCRERNRAHVAQIIAAFLASPADLVEVLVEAGVLEQVGWWDGTEMWSWPSAADKSRTTPVFRVKGETE